jgi:hypothetical protein
MFQTSDAIRASHETNSQVIRPATAAFRTSSRHTGPLVSRDMMMLGKDVVPSSADGARKRVLSPTSDQDDPHREDEDRTA